MAGLLQSSSLSLISASAEQKVPVEINHVNQETLCPDGLSRGI